MLSSRAKNGMLTVVIALGTAVGLSACASSNAARSATGSPLAFGGDQGAASEVVFAPFELGEPSFAPEYARRDSSLGIGADSPRLASLQWPQPERASLENARTLNIRDRDGRFTYFVPDRTGSRRYGGEWGR